MRLAQCENAFKNDIHEWMDKVAVARAPAWVAGTKRGEKGGSRMISPLSLPFLHLSRKLLVPLHLRENQGFQKTPMFYGGDKRVILSFYRPLGSQIMVTFQYIFKFKFIKIQIKY